MNRFFGKILVVVILIFAGCSDVPDKLVAPSWNTELNIPLANRDYSLEDIINDSQYISIDTNDHGKIFVFRSDTVEYSYSIGNYLKDKLNFSALDIEIPIVEGKGSTYFSIDELLDVDSSVINGGNLIIKIQNNSPDPMEFRVIIPRLKNNGIPFEIHETLQGNEAKTENRSLLNFIYAAPDDPPGQVLVEAEIIEGNMNGTVSLDVEIEESSFEYFKGRIPTATLETVQYSVSLPITETVRNLRNKITIENPKLYIKAYYKSDAENIFEAMLHHVRVIAKTKEDEIRNMETPDGDNNMGDLGLSGGILNEVFDESNSNIGYLLALMPDSLTLTADIIMNPENKYGEATSRDTIFLELCLKAETIIGIDSVSYTDSLDFAIDDDQRDLIRKGKSAEITVKLFNGIALETDMNLDFVSATGDTMWSTSLAIEPADVNQDGFAVLKKFSENIIILDSNQIKKVADTEMMYMKLGLSTTKQQLVVLSPDDSLRVNSYSKFMIHLDPNSTE